MSAYKIGCPHCSQHIECDETYAGVKINCPSCQQEMVIPPLGPPAPPPPRPVVVVTPTTAAVAAVAAAPAASPAPPPSAAPRLTVRPAHTSTSAPAAPPPPVAATAPAPAPMPRSLPPRSLLEDEPPPSKGKLILKVAIAVVLAAPLLYFALQWASKTQNKFNEDRAKDDDPGVIGGQLGHLADLNRTLDATDPSKMGRFPDDGGRRAPGELPVIMPTWTLDLNAAKIPEGKACGKISKLDFVADDNTLITSSATPVLKLSWPDFRESEIDLLVYLRMKSGQGLENSTWTVAADQKGGDIAQVIKRWKVTSDPQQQQRAYTAGFVAKLEFGKRTEAGLPGKIYVALPDEEKTVVAGKFSAVLRAASASQGPGRNRRGAGMAEE